CKVALASSSNMNYIDLALDSHHLRDRFDVIVNRDFVKNGKPSPDLFLVAAEKLGLDPKDCYVVEDSIPGVRAGLDAGCATIMVPDVKKPLPEFYEQCIGIYDSLKDVLTAFQTKQI
ncbi:MAG: HAD family hydrolase, partial [Erysipelotrichaceae bacterium]|nr:HAD family hydrolase [Erysipelotrichaceae bacterium]